ncbi:hypothetical protein [Methyloversatilis sp.]
MAGARAKGKPAATRPISRVMPERAVRPASGLTLPSTMDKRHE